MKKFAAVVLSAAMMVSLAACGGQSDRNAGSTGADQTQGAVSQEAKKEESQSPEESDPAVPESQNTGDSASIGKTLVVYYSATGNTREVAEYIGKVTGGELFELEPVQPYSGDDLNWRDENSRVTREHDNPDERDVELKASTVPDWESYENIFIGYPNMEGNCGMACERIYCGQ